MTGSPPFWGSSPIMALVGTNGSGATIFSDGEVSTVGRDQRQDPVRKMRGLIAGATHSAVKLASR